MLADVGGDEDVEHHHGSGVDHHLRRGDELSVQQEEQARERHEVDDEREHAVERVAQEDHGDRPRERADRPDEEADLDHGYPNSQFALIACLRVENQFQRVTSPSRRVTRW